MHLEHEPLTERIIGAAIRVHRELGPGFLESVYENALVIELQRSGMKVEQQMDVPVLYTGIAAGHASPGSPRGGDDRPGVKGHQCV